MRVKLNDDWIVIPSALSEVTLKQRIDFYNQHGRDLEAMAQSIIAMDDEFLKELETTQFHFEKMFRTFAFFANCTVESIKESQFIDKVASIYYACLEALVEEQTELELQYRFTWNKETWILNHPELKHGDKMTFGEFIDSKQIVQDMIGLGRGKWECMLPLCAIFLRKEGEKYQESFLYEGSDRLRLMETLPMSIAIHVAFFLNGSLSMYLRTLQSSSHLVPSPVGSTSKLTLSHGDG